MQGTYADENDSLSEYIPSPPRAIESNFTFMNKINTISENQSKIKLKGRNKGHYSQIGKKVDQKFISVKRYANKNGVTVDDYVKPTEPSYFKDNVSFFLEKKKERLQNSIELKTRPEKVFGGQSRQDRHKYLTREKHPLNNDLGLDQKESYSKLLHIKKRNNQAYFS